MVNTCCVTGCKSLYSKEDYVKPRLHRFPLLNPETLPAWIAATGRGADWKPCKSSRLCGNHFVNSDYIIGHGKNILKPYSVPTIEYRIAYFRKYLKRRKSQNSCIDMEQGNHPLKVKLVEKSDTIFDDVQLDYNDMYNLKYEHQNNGEHLDHGVSYDKNENEKCTVKNEHLHFTNLGNSHDNKNDSCHDDAIKNEYKDFNNEQKNYICNRENQCYIFTSSFKDFNKPIVLIPPQESLNMNIDQTTADLNVQEIMALNYKKGMDLKLKKKQRTKEKYKNYLDSDTHSFSIFVKAQMKNLRPYRKVYSSAKQKIQKILMKAQLKISN